MPKKEYLTIEEAAKQIGVQRSSLYHYINLLNIPRHRFKLSRHSYLAMTDVERIKEVKEKPWTIGHDEKSEVA